MNNNRNNRRRGRGNRNNQGGGNSQNRIDSRARGNAPQLLDKYKKLAQDAQHNGDRVQAEYYLQFADHYFRVIADNKARQEEARAKRNEERGQSGDDGDEDDGDNRRKNSRRSRSRRDDQDNSPSSEGEAGVEGEASSGDEEGAKPKRRARKPKSDDQTDDQGGKPRRKPRGNGRESGGNDDATAGEIDSSVLPPAIGGDEGPKSSDSDDNLEAVS